MGQGPFFLDDADRALIEPKRRSHNRLGFAAQLTTARCLGVFMDDPTDIPAEVADYLAEQLGIADASVLKAYGEWENTRLDHVRELRQVQVKVQANLQEGRHALARKIFRGLAGQLCQRYQDGMEDQIGALGLVLHALVLCNTRYIDAAVT